MSAGTDMSAKNADSKLDSAAHGGCPASKTWMLSKIENHTAKPMTLEEVEAHIADYNRLRELCAEQSAALKWARELMEQPNTQT